MVVDITPLIENDVEYEKLVEVVKERYRCEWDDTIHDSYGRFVSQLAEYTRQIRSIRCKVETVVKEAEELKLDNVITKADELCKEADLV